MYKQTLTIDEYLTSETGGLAHRSQTLEEMLMLWLANLNPAFEPFKELFDDGPLEKDTAYPLMMTGLREFFAAQPAFGLANQNLIDLLRAPALVAPDSLAAQLDFMRSRWGIALGRLAQRVLGGLDFIKEEESRLYRPARFQLPVFGPDSQQASLALFGSGAIERAPEPELENFSPDRDWMPRLVLIAKNTYVWLDQLSQEISTRHHAAGSDPR